MAGTTLHMTAGRPDAGSPVRAVFGDIDSRDTLFNSDAGLSVGIGATTPARAREQLAELIAAHGFSC